MLEKKNNNWIADNWDEMGFDLGKKRYKGGDMKIKCIACEEVGGADRGSTDASINPDSGIGHCFKCGTAFLIRKQEQVSKKEVKPITLKNRTLLSKEGLDLLKSRRITQEAINRHKLVETNKMIVFPFFYNGQFVNAKMRGIAEKHFTQTPGGYHIVYNYDNCIERVEKSKAVIIVEGEIDSLSWESAGIDYSVSLDSGAPNPKDKSVDGKFECITNSMELFDAADTIYIAVDNDTNGKLAEKELIRRFPPEKVRLVSFGKYKDSNEYLMYEGPDKMPLLLTAAKEIKMDGIFTASDVHDKLWDMLTNGLTRGSSTYIESIDRAWKWRPGEVNLWTGYNNDGKSNMLRYLELVKAKFDGWKFGLFIPEDMPMAEWVESMIHMYIGKPTDTLSIEPEELMAAEQFINEHFFVVYPEDGFGLDSIINKIVYLVRRHGIRSFDIDPYNQVEHEYGKSMREDLYISQFMSKLKRVAVQYDIAINCVAHQIKPESVKVGEDYAAPTRYNIKGGGTFADKADNVLCVWRHNRRSVPTSRMVTFISDKIKKQKLVGEADLHVELKYDFHSNRYLDPAINYRSVLDMPLAFGK